MQGYERDIKASARHNPDGRVVMCEPLKQGACFMEISAASYSASPGLRLVRRLMSFIPSRENPANRPNRMTCARSPLGSMWAMAHRKNANSSGCRCKRTIPALAGSKPVLELPPKEKGFDRPKVKATMMQTQSMMTTAAGCCQGAGAQSSTWGARELAIINQPSARRETQE